MASLSGRSAWAVATAGGVYREIGVKVDAAGARAWDVRVSTSKLDKLRLISLAAWRASTRHAKQWPPRPTTLWQRPRHPCEAAPRATCAVVHAGGQ